MLRRSLSLSLVLLSAACVPVDQVRFDPPPAATGLTGDAVILEDEQRIVLQPAEERTRIEGRGAVWVGSSAGAEAFRLRVVVPPDGVLATLGLRQITPDGKATRIPVERGRGSDRVLVVPLPALPAKTVVQWAWTVTVDGVLTERRHHLPTALPIRAARIEVVAPDDTELVADAEHFARVGPMTWQLEDWRPATPQPFAPVAGGAPSVRWTIQTIGPRVYTSNWAIAAQRMFTRIAHGVRGAPSLVELPADLPRAEQIERIWRGLQRRFGARAPSPDGLRDTDALAKAKTATDDERALLMFVTLHAQGIPARLALVPPLDAPPLFANLPLAHIAGRLLVAVPRAGGHQWLDPGCRGCTAGQLLAAHRGRHAVLMDPAPCEDRSWWTDPKCRTVSTHLARTPDQAHLIRPPRLTQTVRFGTGRQTIERWRLTLNGVEAAAMRAAPQPRGQRLAGIEGGTLTLEGADRHGEPLHLVLVDGARDGPFSLAALNPQPWLDAFTPDRTVAVQFHEPPGFSHELILTGAVPPERLPVAGRVESAFGTYTLEVDPLDDRHEIAERLQVTRLRIEPEQYADWLAFLTAIQALRRPTPTRGATR